jgi:hypothetical protein
VFKGEVEAAGIFASWSEPDSRSGDLEKKRILKDGNFR